MNHSLTKISRSIRGFNKRAFGGDDFWRLTRREGIHVNFWKLKKHVNGFYGLNRKYRWPVKYIVINQRHLPNNWLLTGFHELMHHFLHAPQSSLEVYFSKTHATAREEIHADRLARMMIIPKPLLLEIAETPFEQLEEFNVKVLRERWKDYQTYGE